MNLKLFSELVLLCIDLAEHEIGIYFCTEHGLYVYIFVCVCVSFRTTFK